MSLIGIDLIWLLIKFGVFVEENHGKLPTLYWLPKLRKKPLNHVLLLILVHVLLLSCLHV